MVRTNTERRLGTGLDDCTVRDRAMSEFPRNLRRGPQLALQADLTDTPRRCSAEPEVMLSGSVDLRLEPLCCGGHEISLSRSLSVSLSLPWSQTWAR